MSNSEIILSDLRSAQETLDQFLNNGKNISAIADAARMISDAISGGGKTISCGNGGSMCDAMHFAEELTGRFRSDRPPYAAVAISDPSYISCVANDYGFDFIFSRYVEAHGRKDDVLFAISTSGNSKNILLAVEAAKSKGMKVIGLTGKDGGKMASHCDVEIRAPKSDYADRAQEIHIKVIHCLIHCIENNLKF
jgi:D-sedoheptulose 7-phosphate isomerase